VSDARALLSIDTSIGTSVALLVGDDALESDGSGERTCELSSADERRHTEAIGGLIARVFEESSVSPEQVDGVVVGIGPGPFTGLRVGIAAAKAFALGRRVPLLPLSGHEAAAYEAISQGAMPAVRILQDARRRELFVTEYTGLDECGLPVLGTAPHLLARADYVEEARDVWPQRIGASTLLRLAQLRLGAGRAFAPDRALYLRQPDVFPSAGPKRVTP
jgi:tRNA threonylcarbamoyl adenosine modification protein YeaZ